MGKVDSMLEYLALQQLVPQPTNQYTLYSEARSEEERQMILKVTMSRIDKELRAKAFKEVLMNKYKSYYSKLLDEEDEEVLPIIKQMNIERREKEESLFKTNYAFITINPKPDVPLTEFRKAVDKASKKTFIKKSLYVIEQRGENLDELGKGFHTHMLIDKGDYRPSHMMREFERTFKNLCDTSNPSCFNIRPCKENDLRKRQKYMLGSKKDPSKHLKQKFDKVFREKFVIRDYYGDKFVDEDIKSDFIDDNNIN